MSCHVYPISHNPSSSNLDLPLLGRQSSLHLPPLRRRRLNIILLQPEIRRPSQRRKDIPDVIARPYPALKNRVPLPQNPIHDLDARQIDVLDSRQEAATCRLAEQVRRGRLAGVRAVEVRGRPHEDDARKVSQVREGGAHEDLEDAVVLLRSRAVDARAVGEQRRRVLEGFAEEIAGEIHVASGNVAGDDRRRLGSDSVHWRWSIVGTVRLGAGGVVKSRLLSERDGDIAEVGV